MGTRKECELKIMTPGPVQVRENVRNARSIKTTNPDVDTSFVEEYKETCDKIAKILHTSGNVYILSGEGILGLECACASLTEKGDRVLVIDNGIYGNGFADFVSLYGGNPVLYQKDYRHTIDVEELRAYWNRFDALKTKRDLCEKLIGHKKNGIVVAYRYASGDINSARNLFFAIQESVKEALLRNGTNYLGENTIKESIIAWLDDSDNKAHLDRLLANPEKEWKALFSQSTADEVIKSLKSNGDVKQLVDNIFTLADKEGITALSINSDKLIAWLTDVIDTNSIKIVLIWDEFSDYFKNNKESLSEFQKIASLVQSKPFYFIVVTHETQSMYVSENDRGNQSKVSDRFKSIPITLPDNIAFNLIGHAFNVKEAAKERWNLFADDLNARIKIQEIR